MSAKRKSPEAIARNHFKHVIREYRDLNGVSVEDLAVCFGKDPRTAYRYLSDPTELPISRLKKIQTKCGIPKDVFIECISALL